jgi:hypothetical protein
VPQGSPLSPLLANLALDDLDHALDRGGDTITYARYLDDMVVLAADTPSTTSRPAESGTSDVVDVDYADPPSPEW